MSYLNIILTHSFLIQPLTYFVFGGLRNFLTYDPDRDILW